MVLLALSATVACGPEARACTEIGAANGVDVTVQGLQRVEDLVVEVCVAGECRTAPLFIDGPPSAFVDLPAVSSTKAIVVRVSVRDQSQRVVVPATEVRATPRKVQPNGPDCDPTAYQAAVTVTA